MSRDWPDCAECGTPCKWCDNPLSIRLGDIMQEVEDLEAEVKRLRESIQTEKV